MPRTTEATVISLADHPTWQAAQRRSQDILDAMRRHPSYLAREASGEVTRQR